MIWVGVCSFECMRDFNLPNDLRIEFDQLLRWYPKFFMNSPADNLLRESRGILGVHFKSRDKP